jgi:hypothetical protein
MTNIPEPPKKTVQSGGGAGDGLTTFGTESEAQAVAAELNAAAERDVRYHAERYREKWAIARQVKRTYWGWDGYPGQLISPKSAPAKNDVETVRQIVNLARLCGR